MKSSTEIRIAVEPGPNDEDGDSRASRFTTSERHRQIREAIVEAGGTYVDVYDANGLVWLNVSDAQPLVSLLDSHPCVQWTQLPGAGVDRFFRSRLFGRPVTFTCAKGAFAEQVGEHALMLTLTSLRGVVKQARTVEWCEVEPTSLHDRRVTILGAGGVAQALIRILAPLRCAMTVVRRQAIPLQGEVRTVSVGQFHSVLRDTDVLILALALTPETRQIIGEPEFNLLPPHAIVVNVARGQHIETNALVSALRDGRIAGAGLDVTDPEPLPTGHPLWTFNNVLITSHCADSITYCTAKLAERVRENVGRLARGEELVGIVDLRAGY